MLLQKMWMNGHTLIFNCSQPLGSMFGHRVICSVKLDRTEIILESCSD